MSQDEDAKSQQAGLPRILVIESNPGYRSVISHVVEIAGGQWESVSEIEQGKKLLDGTKFDLVIIGADDESRIAPDVLKEIRALARAPLIILDESFSGALETFEAGADQILPKPFVPDALIGAIKVELRGPNPSSLVALATRIELGGLVFAAERRVVQRGETEVGVDKT
jgi:DNA-binding response OmpR family regulator